MKSIIIICLIVISFLVSIFVTRTSWKGYIILYLSSTLVGLLLCYIFIELGFYVFPFRLVSFFPLPLIEMLTVLPTIVITSVRYSPIKWGYKIAYYWAIVHTIMFFEVLALFHPLQFIDYKKNSDWDVWDSYTWWWIYLLVFDYVGGLLIPIGIRKPIQSDSFRYGKLVWFVVHFIFILTIFLGGIYVGVRLK